MRFGWLKINWPYHLTGSGYHAKRHQLIMSMPFTTEWHPGPFWDCPDPRCGPDWRGHGR